MQVISKDPLMSNQKVYRQLVNESDGGPRHIICTPRDPNQVKNFRKECNRQIRISHDAMFNTYQLCFQLQFNDRRGVPQDFIRQLQVYPTVIGHLIPHPLLESLETLLKVSTEPVILHYDTVFNMGDFYLSTLVFRHSMFSNNPIIPTAFFIHSRRFQEDHTQFVKVIRKSLPLVASKRIIMVTDREFDFSEVFPLSLHVFCWNHLERDLHFYLKNTANCKSSEISFYANAFSHLMSEVNKEEFDMEWDKLKLSFASKSVLNYFEQKLLPAFKEHSSIWKLKENGVPNPEYGLTNNASESLNAVLHSLQQWKQAPLDVICVSLYHLSCYYHREIVRAFHACGTWDLKEEYAYFQRDPSLMPFLPKTIEPKDIVARVRGEIVPTYEEIAKTNGDSTKQEDKSVYNSQLSLAHEAICNKRVSLTDQGCWVVIGTDGITPYAVRLFPKETCTCSAVKMCYHLMACKLMVGQSAETFTSAKPNMTLLGQKARRKNKEGPSGRKKPRRKDFEDLQNGKTNGKSNTHNIFQTCSS